MVDGPLGVDQSPALVFASQTRSQHLPPSRAETRATGTRVTVPGICSSDRNKPTSPAMRDNLWMSRADGSLPPHVHKDVGAAWRSADSTSIRKLGDSASTGLVRSTQLSVSGLFPLVSSQVCEMTKVIAGASAVPVWVLDGDGVVWRAEEVDVARTRL